MAITIGVIGCGSVFGHYADEVIRPLEAEGRLELAVAADPDPAREPGVVERFPDAAFSTDPAAVIGAGIDLVAVLTPTPFHSRYARPALEAGKHVLLEKPMATNLADAAEVVTLAEQRGLHLFCAPHVFLTDTYRRLHERVSGGEIGRVHQARACYGFSPPRRRDWAWYWRKDAGPLFDLGVYNLTSLVGILGSVERVAAFAGRTEPSREFDGVSMEVEVDDNLHLLLDFGQETYASLATGFTMIEQHTPTLEFYGSRGTIQMLGYDWQPDGLEVWTVDRPRWERIEEAQPDWKLTHGLFHLIDCLETGRTPVTSPRHAYHVLEVMLRAFEAAAAGVTQVVESRAPVVDYTGF